MAEITKTNLLTSINTDLADNNAGLISAEDVRSNIYDTADSINAIVCSGDTDGQYPFYNNVRLKKISTVGGKLFAESGIRFPNAPNNASELQVEPFLGVGNIQHNSLAGLTTGDPHTQYMLVAGTRTMTGNLKLGSNWIGASGYNGDGFKFSYSPTGTSILTSGTLVFPDNSVFGSAKGVAKAWINFDASGNAGIPSVRTAYNITALEDLGVGKFRVTFASGILGTGYPVAVGQSNATTASGSKEDFDVNTVGLVLREGVDPNKKMTFAIRNDAGNYVDGEINDLVVFADGPNVVSDSGKVVVS